MIKILGTLKGVVLKSKVGDDNKVIHFVDLKLELLEGQEKIQDLVESLKEIIQLEITNKQPSLIPTKPYKDNEDDE